VYRLYLSFHCQLSTNIRNLSCLFHQERDIFQFRKSLWEETHRENTVVQWNKFKNSPCWTETGRICFSPYSASNHYATRTGRYTFPLHRYYASCTCATEKCWCCSSMLVKILNGNTGSDVPYPVGLTWYTLYCRCCFRIKRLLSRKLWVMEQFRYRSSIQQLQIYVNHQFFFTGSKLMPTSVFVTEVDCVYCAVRVESLMQPSRLKWSKLVPLLEQ
jgi:hypothetical protein